MSARTRYLQLSDTTMMEYVVNETTYDKVDSYIHTVLADGHHAIFSTVENEVVKIGTEYVKRDNADIITLNNILHMAIPADEKSSNLFYFINNDYSLVDENIYTELNSDNIIAKEYGKYCKLNVTSSSTSDDNSEEKFEIFNTNESLGFDIIKLYFVSGYDFSDIYAGLLRLSVPRNDGKFLDLCNFIYTKGIVHKYIKFMTKPIIFGNFIYDKYIEIAVPSVKNFYKVPYNDKTLGDILLGDNGNNAYEPNVRILFSYIDEDDKKISDINVYDRNILLETYKNVKCIFSKTNSISGIIPTQNLTSDNLGVYIAESPDYPYLEFYGTWKGEPLTNDIVNKFNISIKLYDRAYVRKEATYEVSKDYEVGSNLNQWVVIHEITSELIDTNLNIVKTETYSMSQIFLPTDTDTPRFYYRPILFDDQSLSLEGLTLHIKYLMRFINVEDGIQFLKQGSLSLTDLNKYNIRLAKLDFNTTPYKVFNKIVENKQTLTLTNASNKLKSKYVKVFYDSTQITLDVNGEAYGNNAYTLVLSRSPKNYKFTFKQRDFNNNLKYFDLSDAYYKLYVKESNGNEIVVEPTYSNNMNIGLGELEFNLNTSIINKLKEVSPADRKMSIVCYNTDGTLTSMYDMNFTI